MPDVFTKTKRSAVMARIRSRGNKETELALAKIFRAHRITGWRRQIQIITSRERGARLRVRPDFVFPSLRLAVFVDGCFWHGCRKHCKQPASNRAFWRRKHSANQTRDALVTRTLRRAGWRVLRVWEHELTWKNQARLLRRIQKALTLL